MKNDYMSQFYTIDPTTGEYILEIALEKYDDIFNSWDSSVYNLRDLDGSLIAFLKSCSYDIDFSHKMKLRFNIKNQEVNEELEKIIIESIHNYYNYSVHLIERNFSRRSRKSILYICISFIFLTLTILSQNTLKGAIVPSLLIQCLTVGGWIFLWEAISILFLQSSEFWKERKIYKRLSKVKMLFRYQ